MYTSVRGPVHGSLFEKDKLLFSFTLAATIFGYKGTLDPTEYRFLLTAGLYT